MERKNMKTTKSYAEKLRDPRWQRLRLEVMESARWECSSCGDSDKELQVHHPAYRKGAEPWEYEAAELLCLCAKCHKETEAGKIVFSEMLLNSRSTALYSNLQRMCIDEAIDSFAQMIAEYVKNTESGFGFSGPGGLSARLMLRELKNEGVNVPEGYL